MIVDLKKFQEACQYVKDVDFTPLDQLVFQTDGKEITVDPKLIEDWKFTGLGAKWFVIDNGLIVIK